MVQLRDYQIRAINQLYDAIRSGNRRLLWVLPTGAGKSSIAAYFVKKCIEKEKRVLFFVHSKELVDQFAERLRNQFHVLSGVIMAGVTPDPSKLVQVASVQTLARRDMPDADVVIIDETHRAEANTYKKVMEAYPDAVVVGLTATPYRGDGKGLGELFQTIVHPVKIRELIGLGHLVGTKVYVPREHVDMTGVKIMAGDYDKKEMANRFKDVGIVKGVVDNYRKYANGKRAIVFNCNVEHSIEVNEMFQRAGISSAHLDGATDKAERKRIVNGFRNGSILVLNNCFLFTEGFDVPACDVVILNRATRSEGLFVQMVGRGLRPADGKEHCVVIDHADNTMRFGFVEDYDLMPFSLEDRKKKKTSDSEIPKTKQCKNCLGLVPFFNRHCQCGYEFPRKEKKITFGEEQEFVVLERDAMIVERLQHLTYGKAKNLPLSQLRLYALLHKYKKGWWFHKAIDEHGLPVIKEHPDAFKQVTFQLQLAEIQDGTHDLYNTLKKVTNG